MSTYGALRFEQPGNRLQTARSATLAISQRGQLQLRRIDRGGSEAVSQAPSVVDRVLDSPGAALDGSARGRLEARLGHDFGRIRIHADEDAARSAEAVNALAYTVGRHIVFGQGRYIPASPMGDGLLAHELTHALQQGMRDAVGGGQPYAVDRDDGAAEHEARSVAVGMGQPQPGAAQVAGAGHQSIQRAPDDTSSPVSTTENCGVRTVSLPCPGSRENAVVLKDGPLVSEGILWVENSGDCEIVVNGQTASGADGGPDELLELAPGQKVFRYTPPSSAVRIRAACFKNCTGRGEVRFDPCVGIA